MDNPDSQKKAPPLRPIFVWGAFLVLFPVVLVLCELLTAKLEVVRSGRARKDSIQSDYLTTRLRPSYRGELVGRPFSTNRFGFRDDDNTLRPAANTVRVLSLGDSVALGAGIEVEDTYAQVLERTLNQGRLQTEFEVINAAGQGYSPSGYWLYLLNEGLEFQPDLVLIQLELSNDVTDEAFLRVVTDGERRRLRGGRYLVAWDGNLLGSVCWGPFGFERTYLYHRLSSRLFRFLYRSGLERSAVKSPESPYFFLEHEGFLLTSRRIEEGWSRLLEAFSEIDNLIKDHGVDLLVLLIPHQLVFVEGPNPKRQGVLALGDRFERETASLGLEIHSPVAEISRGGGSALYIDFAHTTGSGHRIIAGTLARKLQSRYGSE